MCNIMSSFAHNVACMILILGLALTAYPLFFSYAFSNSAISLDFSQQFLEGKREQF